MPKGTLVKVLLLGYSNAAARIAEQFCRQGAEVTFVLCQSDLPLLEPLLGSRLTTVPVLHLHPDCLPLGDLSLDAVVIATDQEQFNIHTALQVATQFPQVQVVTRLFNLSIGHEIEQQLPNVRVLSVSEHAAPRFAAAALCSGVVNAWKQDDGLWAQLDEGEVQNGRRLLIGDLPWQGPDSTANGWWQQLMLPRLFPDQLSVTVVAGLVLVVLFATAYFSANLALHWSDALYFVVTTLTTTGYGDFSLKDAPFTAKMVGMSVMLSGAGLFTILFALVTDQIFRARLDFMLGRRRVRLSGHVIVCGAGDVGVRVVENLLLTSVPVVVIEQDPDHRFNQRIRDLGVPLILADATIEETLRLAAVEYARAIVCATDSDMHNLEIGLSARVLHPEIRTVLRTYDRSFAEQIQKSFSFDAALSSTALAAPAFVKAASGNQTA